MKKKLSLFLAVMLSLLLLLSACAENEPPQDDETPESTFDWDDAMQNIWLDGKKISLPFTLEDLGVDYYFDEHGTYLEDDENLLYTEIRKNGNSIIGATLYGYLISNYNNRKSVITGLNDFYVSILPVDFGIYDLRLGREITTEKVLDVFGDEINISANEDFFEIKNSEFQSISFVVLNGKITYLTIRNNKEDK